ncbi:MAG TPA: hypothetical protein VJB99_03270 [Patescibacteria group bacterium]|nr:hypothetical protein [Patescibacteria group bacterium]
MPHRVTEICGWIGVVAVLAAYAFLNFGFLSLHHPIYAGLNAVGSVGIILDAWNQKNYQPVVLNTLWFAIAIFALLRATGLFST